MTKNKFGNKKVRQKTEKSVFPEFRFFIETPLKEYEGSYVALLGKKVVASRHLAKDVWEKARKKYPKYLPTIAKVPRKEVLVMI